MCTPISHKLKNPFSYTNKIKKLEYTAGETLRALKFKVICTLSCTHTEVTEGLAA